MEDKICFRATQAYLEQARSCLRSEVSRGMSPNLMYALAAQTYIFSYLALLSFISMQVSELWNAPSSPLQKRFPNAKDLKHLLSSDLKEVKDAIKVLCEELQLEKLHDVDQTLWNDLTNVLKPVRDFFSHPYPDSETLNKIMDEALKKHSWNFPSRVAENVISYFYKKTNQPIPDWVKQNKEFSVLKIQNFISGKNPA